MWIWDAAAFLVVSFTLGAFTFWLGAYFAWETIRYFLFGPSEQLQSVGTSILDEPTLEARKQRAA